MGRLLRAVLGVVVVLLAVGGRAGADDPGGTPSFPYGELAMWGAAEARLRVVVGEGAAVRLRPAADWPTVEEAGVGDVLAVVGITPGRDPWLRVEWDASEGKRSGWVRLGDVDDAPAAGVARLPLEWAEPILAKDLYWGDWETPSFYAWPGGGGTGYGLLGGPWPVAGRSVDGEWVAVRARGLSPSVVWLPAGRMELSASELSVTDLPIFVGRETIALPLGERGERAARTIRPAAGWGWADSGVVLGWRGQEVWTYALESGDIATRAAPTTGGLPSPDGRWLAITDCVGGAGSCRNAFGLSFFSPTSDVGLFSLTGARHVVFHDVLGRTGTQREGEIMHGWGWPGRWSPDSQVLLVSSFHRGEGEPGRHWSGATWTALTVDGEEYQVDLSWLEPVLGDRSHPCNLYAWSAGSDHTLIFEGMCDGMSHVFGLDGTLLRSERRTKLNEIAGVDALGVEVEAEWSPDGSLAAVTSVVGGLVWLYRASERSLLSLDVPGLPEDHWAAERWRPSWSPDGGTLVLVGRAGRGCGLAHYDSIWLVDAGSGATREVGLDGARYRVCGTSVEWSADGEWWWIEVSGDVEQKGEQSEDWRRYGRDGLAAPSGQVRIYDRGGALAHVFRTERDGGGGWARGSTHRAGWSADGQWLVIGGRNETVRCRCGH